MVPFHCVTCPLPYMKLPKKVVISLESISFPSFWKLSATTLNFVRGVYSQVYFERTSDQVWAHSV